MHIKRNFQPQNYFFSTRTILTEQKNKLCFDTKCDAMTQPNLTLDTLLGCSFYWWFGGVPGFPLCPYTIFCSNQYLESKKEKEAHVSFLLRVYCVYFFSFKRKARTITPKKFSLLFLVFIVVIINVIYDIFNFEHDKLFNV